MSFPDSSYLTNRAEQCRSLAKGFLDPLIRNRMLELASCYDELAKSALSFKDRAIKVQKLGD
jgi:hypothetical protein